jgi:hypothetical protein
VLISSGVLGDERRDPRPSREALEIHRPRHAIEQDLEVARSLGGPIEWRFSDAEAWHVVVTNGHAEAKPGSAGAPALVSKRLRRSGAKITVERTTPARSLAARRLRLHGSLSAKVNAPKLFR